MVRKAQVRDRTYRAYGRKDLDSISQLQDLSHEALIGMKAVSAVLPFRTNNYVVEELIDWSRIPEDPIFQLTFPQQGMLETADFEHMYNLFHREAPEKDIQAAAREIQLRMNPHPAGQMDLNVPTINGERLNGVQHKYRETVLFFPPVAAVRGSDRGGQTSGNNVTLQPSAGIEYARGTEGHSAYPSHRRRGALPGSADPSCQ